MLGGPGTGKTTLLASAATRRIAEGADPESVLVLTTVGRRSGAERANPVRWFPGPDADSWVIVASAGGAVDNPGWYYNLGAHPDQARIDVDGSTIPVTAEQLHGEVREQTWQQIVAVASGFGDYQKKTDRELPIIRLTRRADAA